MSSRCQAFLLLACLGLIAAEPTSTPKDKSTFLRLGTPRLQQQRGTVAAFSPNGKLLALHDSLWDVDSNKKLRDLHVPEFTFPVTQLVFSADGKSLAGLCGPTILLWETATGKERRFFSSPAGSFYAFAISPDSKCLAASAWDDDRRSEILLWDLATGR